MNAEQEIEKLKYHQSLLLTMLLDKEDTDFSFFHMILNYNLSSEETKEMIHSGSQIQRIKESLNAEYVLKSLIAQNIHKEIILKNR
ncbi:DUF1878 family protein [Bacillus smithii]|uniref:Uncharacterized protein n=1 Tax=Bacillus smithii 7_3_47FAA TaxID=665952 RepID=G9QHG7_9BACI|nr:DUF1878 family protein [Bacillus smithii]EHL79412.1 hypothetical protein HMPREF1015_01226 [Bacillus smithii 7_3_47FAA]